MQLPRDAETKMPESQDVSQELPSQPAIVTPPLEYSALVAAIAQAHDRAQRQAAQAVNVSLTLRNWLIGYYVVEYQQHGSDRAQYGERLIENLARDLRRRLGRGFGRSEERRV